MHDSIYVETSAWLCKARHTSSSICEYTAISKLYVYLQVAYWIGAASGAALSAYLSGSWGTTAVVNPWLSFLGGAAMLFGARMASGCTR